MTKAQAWIAGVKTALRERLSRELDYPADGTRSAYIEGYHAGYMTRPLEAFGRTYPGVNLPNNPYLKSAERRHT